MLENANKELTGQMEAMKSENSEHEQHLLARIRQFEEENRKLNHVLNENRPNLNKNQTTDLLNMQNKVRA